MGRFEEAFAAINRARMIDPLSLTISSVLGMTFHYAGRYDEAIAQQRKTIELDPNFPWAHAYLATSSARKGMYTEAIAEAQKALRLSVGSPRILAGLGRVYAQAGDTRKAEEVLEQLHELEKRQYVTPFHTALIYEALGRNDEAFIWLDKAYAERSAPLIYAKVLPFRDSFRSDSRMADLLARMNLGSEVE
jgi:tetratricopeptide (TPR) repeat protein